MITYKRIGRTSGVCDMVRCKRAARYLVEFGPVAVGFFCEKCLNKLLEQSDEFKKEDREDIK